MKKRPDPEMTDRDNPAWTRDEARKAVPLSGLPESLRKKLRGRPKAAQTKERITIRLSPEVLEAFRATGAGWQTRIDGALKEWLATASRRPAVNEPQAASDRKRRKRTPA